MSAQTTPDQALTIFFAERPWLLPCDAAAINGTWTWVAMRQAEYVTCYSRRGLGEEWMRLLEVAFSSVAEAQRIMLLVCEDTASADAVRFTFQHRDQGSGPRGED